MRRPTSKYMPSSCLECGRVQTEGDGPHNNRPLEGQCIPTSGRGEDRRRDRQQGNWPLGQCGYEPTFLVPSSALGFGTLCCPVVLILLWKLCGVPSTPQRPGNKLEVPVFLISRHMLIIPAFLGATRVLAIKEWSPCMCTVCTYVSVHCAVHRVVRAAWQG